MSFLGWVKLFQVIEHRINTWWRVFASFQTRYNLGFDLVLQLLKDTRHPKYVSSPSRRSKTPILKQTLILDGEFHN
jgi:hypothetical protein